ncbi:MAG: hypothetical protein ACRDRI_23245, partial [Pseudonocardiaceae bacterium]
RSRFVCLRRQVPVAVGTQTVIFLSGRRRRVERRWPQLLARVRERESMVARRQWVIAELKRCLTALAAMVSV